jgi:hypothetical protein
MSENKVPKKRQAISLATKIAILDRLDAGEGSTLVDKSLGYNEATIRTIHKSKAKIRAARDSKTCQFAT